MSTFNIVLLIILLIVYIVLFIKQIIAFAKKKQKDKLSLSLENLKKENERLEKKLENVIETYDLTVLDISKNERQIALQKETIENLKNHCEDIKKTTQQVADTAFESYCEVLENSYKQEELEYDKKLSQLQESYNQEQDFKIKELEIVEADLEKLKNTQHSIIDAMIREQASSDISKYKLNPTIQEITDIELYNSIKNKLSNPRVLSMLIWSTYFQKEMTKLCNALLGNKTITGIYKITNKNSGLVYIGQSVDIARRWKDHAKHGLGIDTPMTNKLYKAMQLDGIWNFTWELLEECPREQLNEKEKFYIEFYRSNEIGYNATKGNN